MIGVDSEVQVEKTSSVNLVGSIGSVAQVDGVDQVGNEVLDDVGKVFEIMNLGDDGLSPLNNSLQ